MATFQSIVLIIAIVLLIICLIIIGVSLANSKKNEVWPPLIGQCPDYWIDLSGNPQCLNVLDLGTCTSNSPGADGHSTMDFSGTVFSGANGNCAKYLWANKCGVSWDGITYGYGEKNPCEATADKAKCRKQTAQTNIQTIQTSKNS